jgi:hypothetical protein
LLDAGGFGAGPRRAGQAQVRKLIQQGLRIVKRSQVEQQAAFMDPADDRYRQAAKRSSELLYGFATAA